MPSKDHSRIGRREFVHRSVAATSVTGLAGSDLFAEQRPQFDVSIKEPFDSSVIPPYSGDHSRVYRYIEKSFDEHLENIRRWLRQPSESTSGRGIEEMARLLQNDLRGLGFQEAEIVQTAGHPGVWGYYDAGAKQTLGLYFMYDVVPVEPQQWRVEPYQASMVDLEIGEVIMDRGAMNQKGPERAFLNAVEAILATEGELPVNLMIAAEGEEEIGSPHYPEIIDRYGDRLRDCLGIICPHNSQNSRAAATLSLGMKGWIYFELTAEGDSQGGPAKDTIGGWYKAIVDSPAWRLVQALATLTSSDGNTIAVPGYYDAIRPINEEEQQLIDGWNGELSQYAGLGVEQWIDGMSDREAFIRFLFDTTMNINGISAGYIGPGAKTIMAPKVTAKLDSTLVPNQRPEKALALIREHLDREGFRDIKVRTLAAYPPSQTSVHAPLVQSVLGVYNKYDISTSVWPRFAATAPFYQFTERLDLPMLLAGLGHGSNLHAPDEYMLVRGDPSSGIAGLVEIENAYVDMLYALGHTI